MSTATQTVLPITDTAQVSSVRTERQFITDQHDNVIAEVLADSSINTYAQPWVVGEPELDVWTTIKPAPVQAKASRASFTRQHTALTDRQARAICSSLAKAGHADEANYLLHHWFPRKSNELIARAYNRAIIDGSHILLDMLAYERQQLTRYSNWDSLPRKVRQALS